MKLKKFFLAVMCVVLICAISVTGTLAYLTAQTESVTNTFVAASGLVTELTLDESEAVYDTTTGLYTLGTKRVQNNSYTVLPGTTLDKDPTVHLVGKTATPSFLYIEVVKNTGDAITCEIDTTNWTLLNSANAPHTGGVVYQYTGPALEEGDSHVGIIKDNKITVNDTAVTGLGAGKTIVFYAYMAQATMDGATDSAAIFNACFKNS